MMPPAGSPGAARRANSCGPDTEPGRPDRAARAHHQDRRSQHDGRHTEIQLGVLNKPGLLKPMLMRVAA